MEQLIMNNADRVRCNVNNNSNNSNAGANSKGDANIHEQASYTGSVSINKLLALTALLLFALIAAPAQAIVVTYTHTDAQWTSPGSIDIYCPTFEACSKA